MLKHTTLEVGLGNGSMLLERLGEDMPASHFVRELLKNSMEAGATVIDWDLDRLQYELEGRLKLSITDNGSGMSGEEMLEKINRFASSGRTMGLDKNFGSGAKISTFPRNPQGTIYLSRKNGVNYQIRFHKDTNGIWGLEQFERPDGSYEHYATVDDSVMPELIMRAGSGTSVILCGKDVDHNTLLPPEGARGGKYNWLIKELNARFMRIDKDIRVRVNHFFSFENGKFASRGWVGIKGQGWFLDKFSEASGVVELDDGDVHWWIIPRDQQGQKQTGLYLTNGHVGLLRDAEIYDLQEGSKGARKLRNFGVVFNASRVVLYVQPKSKLQALPNTARTTLLVRGRPFPWDYFASGFRENVPPEIQEIERVANEEAARLFDQSSISRNLRSIFDKFLKVSRYKPAENGQLKTIPTKTQLGGTHSTSNKNRTAGSSRSGGNHGGSKGNLYEIFQSPNGLSASKINTFQLPDVKWVKLEDGSRTEDDGLEDRAASYAVDAKVITANANFRVYEDTEKRLLDLYGGRTEAAELIPSIVRKWYSQQLIETILMAEQIKGSKFWAGEHFAQLVSEEALTAAMLAKFNLIHVMKNEIESIKAT